MKKYLPKLKPFELSQHIMDLLLISEGNQESVKEPKVRIIWHILFFSIVSFHVLGIIALPILRSLFPNSQQMAMIWRFGILSFYIYVLLLACILGYRHYVYLLRTAKDLTLKNIIFFYFFGTIIFAYIYQSLYLVNASLFSLTNPILIPKPYLMDIGYNAYLILGDFIIYSLTIIVSLEYPRIQSASLVVSIVNIFEVLYGLAIIVLVVATFVQMSTQVKKK